MRPLAMNGALVFLLFVATSFFVLVKPAGSTQSTTTGSTQSTTTGSTQTTTGSTRSTTGSTPTTTAISTSKTTTGSKQTTTGSTQSTTGTTQSTTTGTTQSTTTGTTQSTTTGTTQSTTTGTTQSTTTGSTQSTTTGTTQSTTTGTTHSTTTGKTQSTTTGSTQSTTTGSTQSTTTGSTKSTTTGTTQSTTTGSQSTTTGSTSKTTTGSTQTTTGSTRSTTGSTPTTTASSTSKTTTGSKQTTTGSTQSTTGSPCASMPCQNGGNCTSNSTDFTCHCAVGYRGRRCQEEINECDNFPCQHNSICVNNNGSYQCVCQSGYTGANCETNIDECKDNHCANGSKCVDGIDDFQCYCPNATFLAGKYCNQTVTIPSDYPKFLSLRPEFGSVSGGTNITITGTKLNLYDGIFAINVGPIRLFVIYRSSVLSPNEMTVGTITLPVNESLAEQQLLPLTFEFGGGAVIDSSLKYTFRKNPTIAKLEPRQFISSGGQNLTVTGTNLDASSTPYMTVDVVYTREDYLNKNITRLFSMCTVKSNSTMICITPPVNATGKTGSQYSYENSTRKRRDAEKVGSDNLEYRIYIGFIFDRFTKYDNTTREIPQQAIEFFDPPSIEFIGKFLYDPSDQYISISGKNLLRACQVSDYRVTIGSEDCSDLKLTDNLLSCRPPANEPPPGNKEHCVDVGGIPGTVAVGRKDNAWACLVYPGSSIVWREIVAVTFGAIGLAVVFVLIFVIPLRCAAYCEKRDNETTHSEQIENSSNRAGRSSRHQSGCGTALGDDYKTYIEQRLNIEGDLSNSLEDEFDLPGSHESDNKGHGRTQPPHEPDYLDRISVTSNSYAREIFDTRNNDVPQFGRDRMEAVGNLHSGIKNRIDNQNSDDYNLDGYGPQRDNSAKTFSQTTHLHDRLSNDHLPAYIPEPKNFDEARNNIEVFSRQNVRQTLFPFGSSNHLNRNRPDNSPFARKFTDGNKEFAGVNVIGVPTYRNDAAIVRDKPDQIVQLSNVGPDRQTQNRLSMILKRVFGKSSKRTPSRHNAVKCRDNESHIYMSALSGSSDNQDSPRYNVRKQNHLETAVKKSTNESHQRKQPIRDKSNDKYHQGRQINPIYAENSVLNY